MYDMFSFRLKNQYVIVVFHEYLIFLCLFNASVVVTTVKMLVWNSFNRTKQNFPASGLWINTNCLNISYQDARKHHDLKAE